MKEEFTYEKVKNRSYSKEKEFSDYVNHYWVYIFVRPISFYVTPFFLRNGIQANTVTLLGMIPLGLSVISNIYGGVDSRFFILGAIFINIWLLFDVIDGNIARFSKSKSIFGGLLDAVIGVGVKVMLPISIGIGLYLNGTYINAFIFSDHFYPNIVLYLSIIWSIFVLFRQIVSLFFSSKVDMEVNKQKKIESLSLIARRVLSLDIPLMFLFSIIGYIYIWFLFYFIFNAISMIGVIIVTLVNAKNIDLTNSLN